MSSLMKWSIDPAVGGVTPSSHLKAVLTKRLRRVGAWELALAEAYRHAAVVYAGIESRRLLRTCRSDHHERADWVNGQLEGLGARAVVAPGMIWRLAIAVAGRAGPRWVRRLLEGLESVVRRRYEALSRRPELATVVERKLLPRQRFTESTCFRALRIRDDRSTASLDQRDVHA